MRYFSALQYDGRSQTPGKSVTSPGCKTCYQLGIPEESHSFWVRFLRFIQSEGQRKKEFKG